MPATIAVSCPTCQATLRVPTELAGKLIRCKKCEGVLEVPDPATMPPPPARPAPTAQPAAPIGFKDDPDNEDDPNPYAVVPDDLDIPRCPFCAKELDPPDTKICLNCGYDMLQRKRHESIHTIAHTPMDWVKHLGPGVLCVFVVIGLIAFDLFVFMNLRGWMTGSILDADEKHEITGEQKFYVQPYCFNLWLGVITAFIGWLCLKFAYKRLVLDWRPEEKIVRQTAE